MPHYVDPHIGLMMGLLRWFLSRSAISKPSSLRNSISIDVSGSEFHDLYPSVEQMEEAFNSARIFRDDALRTVAKTAVKAVRDGAGYKKAAATIVQMGSLLDKQELSERGFHRSERIGDEFLRTLKTNDVLQVQERIQDVIHTVSAQRNNLHNLRRFAEAGISTVVFMSPKDERSSPIEVQLDGQEMSLDDARALLLTKPGEIKRSAFRAVVVLDGKRFS